MLVSGLVSSLRVNGFLTVYKMKGSLKYNFLTYIRDIEEQQERKSEDIID